MPSLYKYIYTTHWYQIFKANNNNNNSKKKKLASIWFPNVCSISKKCVWHIMPEPLYSKIHFHQLFFFYILLLSAIYISLIYPICIAISTAIHFYIVLHLIFFHVYVCVSLYYYYYNRLEFMHGFLCCYT